MPVAILPIATQRYQAAHGFVPRRLVSPEPVAVAGGDEEDYIEFEDPRLVFTNQEEGLDPELIILNTLRQERDSCDLVLFVQEQEILAHRKVIGAFSPTLRDLIATALSAQEACWKSAEEEKMEGIEDRKHRLSRPLYLEFPSLDFNAFQAIIDYAYTSKLEIRASKVNQVYKVASFLKVTSAACAASAYLAQNLAPANAIGIRRSANKTSDVGLASTVDGYINHHFPEIINASQEFTALPTVQVEVICDGDAAEEAPSELVSRILVWFQAQSQPDNREFRIEYLTQTSHMLYMDGSLKLRDCRDIEDSVSVSNSDLVVDYKVRKRSEKTCGSGPIHINQSAGNTSILNRSDHRHRSGESSKASPPSPTDGLPTMSSYNINLANMGGGRTGLSSSESISSICSSIGAVSSETDEIQWQAIAVAKVSDSFIIALVVMHQRLVALSIQVINAAKRTLRGSEGKQPTSGETSPNRHSPKASFSSMNEEEVGPTPLSGLAAPRCSNALVVIGNRLIAAGGYDRGECLASVEAVTLDDRGEFGPWQSLAPMREERGRFDAVQSMGKLWAIGGSSGLKDLSSVEVWDSETETWTYGPSMLFPKSNHGAASLGSKIYCVGGWNGQIGIKEVEVLDLAMECPKWSLAPSLSSGRYQAACAGIPGLGVLAVGGCEHWGCLPTAELLPEGGTQWLPLPNMSKPRRGAGLTLWNGKIWVVGGSDGQKSLTSTEVLNLSELEKGWLPGPSLTSARANVRIAVLHNRLVAVGGFSGKSFLSTMEFLPSEKDEWKSWNVSSPQTPL